MIRYVAAREVPYEPAVDGTAEKEAAGCALIQTVDVV